MSEKEHTERTWRGIIPPLIGLVTVPIPFAVIVGAMRAARGLSNDPIRDFLIGYATTIVLPMLLLIGAAFATTAFVRWTEGYIRG